MGRGWPLKESEDDMVNRLWMPLMLAFGVVAGAGLMGGCTHHTIEADTKHEITIHATVDVNLAVKIDRELEDVFDALDSVKDEHESKENQ